MHNGVLMFFFWKNKKGYKLIRISRLFWLASNIYPARYEEKLLSRLNIISVLEHGTKQADLCLFLRM